MPHRSSTSAPLSLPILAPLCRLKQDGLYTNLTTRGMTNVLWAFAKLNIAHADMFETLADQVMLPEKARLMNAQVCPSRGVSISVV